VVDEDVDYMFVILSEAKDLKRYIYES